MYSLWPENVSYDNICTKNIQLNGIGAFKRYIDCEPVFSKWSILVYKRMSLVMLFVLILAYHSTRLELTRLWPKWSGGTESHFGCKWLP